MKTPRIALLAIVALSSCGPQTTKGHSITTDDAGRLNLIEDFTFAPELHVYCKKWEHAQYFDVGRQKIVYFEWCSEW